MENHVKERREAFEMSVRGLSIRSGVPESTISEVENGRREPGVYTALKLAKALETTVEQLFTLKAF